MSTMPYAGRLTFIPSLDQILELNHEVRRAAATLNRENSYSMKLMDDYTPFRFESGREFLSVNVISCLVREIPNTKFLICSKRVLLTSNQNGQLFILRVGEMSDITKEEYDVLLSSLRSM